VFSQWRPRRTKFTSLSALGALVGVAAVAAPAQAALSAMGAIDPATKAPAFYQDANGLQLGLCHPGTVNCGPVVPGEDFYNMATSTVTMPNGGTASLTLNMTLAPNVTGDPSAFNRVRIQLDGAPAGTYSITHPYGTDTVTVASAGARGRTTTDIGCLVAASGPCAFASAMAGRYGPFLTAAPGGAAPPAGFIGDAVTPVPVVGSPLGTNFFRVEGPGLPAGGVQSNTFALMGKLFGGVVPAFTSSGDVAFADQLVSSAGTTKTVTVTSAGIPGAGSNLTVKSVAVGGANAGDYTIASNTCNGATLPSGSTCSIGVSFAPSAAGARSATLTIADNTATATHVIALDGKGTIPPPPPVVAAAVPAPAPVVVQAPVLKPLALKALNAPSRLRLRVARHAGIGATFSAPAGANVARVRLLKGGVPVATKLVALATAGRQTVHLRAPRARAGQYVLEVTIGASASSLTAPKTARLTLIR
jgi:hypothetical protein